MTYTRLAAGLLTVLCCAPALLSAKPEKKPEKFSELREILIEGVPRIEIKGDKPSYIPKLDPTITVQEFLVQQLKLPSFSSKLLVNLPSYLPAKLASRVVLTPWRICLTHPPVLDFTSRHARRLKVGKWRLVITDDRGTVFHTIKGKRKLPERLTWDGRNKYKEMMKVGHPYAYSYHILDRANVPHYVRGKTLLFNGLVDARVNQITVSMNTDTIFIRGPKLSESGRNYMRETPDQMRKAATGSVQVTVYGRDLDLARKQADLIREYLIDAMPSLQEKNISARGRRSSRKEYARTEIIGR